MYISEVIFLNNSRLYLMLAVQMRPQLHLMTSIVLFGHDIHFKSDNIFDLIILRAKFFIYKCKINNCICSNVI